MTSALGREERSEWYDDHALETVGDLLRYPLPLDEAAIVYETANPIPTTDTSHQPLLGSSASVSDPSRSHLDPPDVLDSNAVWTSVQDSTLVPGSSNHRAQLSSWTCPSPQMEVNTHALPRNNGTVVTALPDLGLFALTTAATDVPSIEGVSTQRPRLIQTSGSRRADVANADQRLTANEADLFW